MRGIFADTSFFIALSDVNDEFHDAAVECSVSRFQTMICTSAVLLELGTHFSEVRHRHLFMRMVEILEGAGTEIVHVDAGLQHHGLKLFFNRPDKNWSLVDCISFVVMQERDLVEAATTDIHFVQAGFIALLRGTAGK